MRYFYYVPSLSIPVVDVLQFASRNDPMKGLLPPLHSAFIRADLCPFSEEVAAVKIELAFEEE